MLLDYAPANCQPQPGAFTFGLGSEKGFPDIFEIVSRDSYAGVNQLCDYGINVLRQFSGGCANSQVPTVRHGIGGVGQKIQK